MPGCEVAPLTAPDRIEARYTVQCTTVTILTDGLTGFLTHLLRYLLPHLGGGGEAVGVDRYGKVEAEERAHVVRRRGAAAAGAAVGWDERWYLERATIATPLALEALSHEPCGSVLELGLA
jgi:hypothetical protein